jgi:hypothetical protein
MEREIEIEAVYHDHLAQRVQLYVRCLIELARQLQAEEDAAAAAAKPVAVTDDASDQPETIDAD